MRSLSLSQGFSPGYVADIAAAIKNSPAKGRQTHFDRPVAGATGLNVHRDHRLSMDW
jgi:hypothetical protein